MDWMPLSCVFQPNISTPRHTQWRILIMKPYCAFCEWLRGCQIRGCLIHNRDINSMWTAFKQSLYIDGFGEKLSVNHALNFCKIKCKHSLNAVRGLNVLKLGVVAMVYHGFACDLKCTILSWHPVLFTHNLIAQFCFRLRNVHGNFNFTKWRRIGKHLTSSLHSVFAEQLNSWQVI